MFWFSHDVSIFKKKSVALMAQICAWRAGGFSLLRRRAAFAVSKEI